MGKYDYVDKRYFLRPDRVAELLTVGLYRKRLLVTEEMLEQDNGNYQSLAGATESIQRDGLLSCPSHHIKYGFEIEAGTDYSMPRRLMTYDACDYERQAGTIWKNCKDNKKLKFAERKSKMRKNDYYYPVINVVLYVGIGHWEGNTVLQNLFHIPEKIWQYVYSKLNNYGFCMVEADYENPMDYKTDLRQFFLAMQCRNDKEKIKALFETPEFAALEWDAQCAIAVHLNNKIITEKVLEEGQTMCKALRDWAEELREDGKKDGKKEGRFESIRNLMTTMKITMEEAMNLLLIPEEDRKAYRE